MAPYRLCTTVWSWAKVVSAEVAPDSGLTPTLVAFTLTLMELRSDSSWTPSPMYL